MGIKNRNNRIKRLAVRCAALRDYVYSGECNRRGHELPSHPQILAMRAWYALWYSKIGGFGLPELQAEVGRLMVVAGCAVPR